MLQSPITGARRRPSHGPREQPHPAPDDTLRHQGFVTVRTWVSNKVAKAKAVKVLETEKRIYERKRGMDRDQQQQQNKGSRCLGHNTVDSSTGLKPRPVTCPCFSHSMCHNAPSLNDRLLVFFFLLSSQEAFRAG